MKKNHYERILPNEVTDIKEILALAKAGKLFRLAEKKMPTRMEVIDNVRTYVKQINHLATPNVTDIDGLWDEVLANDIFVDMLMPGTKARKCKSFNKYTVMRIVGVMHGRGVYDTEITDSKLCCQLEHTDEDNSYRSFLGQGFDERTPRNLLIGMVKKFTNS